MAPRFLKMLKLPKAPDALPPLRIPKRYLLVQRFGFATIGIDPTSLERTIYNRYLAWIPMLCTLTLLWPMALYALKCVNVDLQKMAGALSPMWQSLQSVVKFFLFMWNKKKIVQLVRNVWFWAMEANEEEQKIIAEENRYDAIVSLLYYSSVYVTGILAVLAPLLVASVYSWKGYDFWEYLEEPLKAVYIVDVKKSVWAYIFCFAWNVVGIHYILNGTLAIDSLFTWFMRNISAQFRILNLRFKLAADNASARKAAGNHSEEEFAKSIKDCVKYHLRIIRMTKKFNEVYENIVFVKFVISCLQLACLTFQIPYGGEIADQIFNVSFLMSVCIQLMLYCYGGQRIKDVSSSVDSSIYEYFQWHDLTVKSKKLLILPLVRSQKPCNLTGIFFVADLGLFLWVFKTAASFMTMMMSMEERKL